MRLSLPGTKRAWPTRRVAGTAAPDYVVLTGSAIHLFVDGGATDQAASPSAGQYDIKVPK